MPPSFFSRWFFSECASGLRIWFGLWRSGLCASTHFAIFLLGALPNVA